MSACVSVFFIVPDGCISINKSQNFYSKTYYVPQRKDRSMNKILSQSVNVWIHVEANASPVFRLIKYALNRILSMAYHLKIKQSECNAFLRATPLSFRLYTLFISFFFFLVKTMPEITTQVERKKKIKFKCSTTYVIW